ncbi:Rho termination factor N-terminal domain-containing protein [Viridibacillus arvi]|uniref:Rho termination factor N-terminal domain-containing protein n=1 Tax=Viridibacillus arvi TaxID=263475 RepID=UPI003D078CC2
MLKEIRQTPTGTEFWDTEEKRTILVGFDIAKGDSTSITAIPVSNTVNLLGHKQQVNTYPADEFKDMSVKELKAFAEEQGIDIPKSMTKRELVIERITGKSGEK